MFVKQLISQDVLFLLPHWKYCKLIGWWIAVNTRTVLAIAPPQGCEAILIKMLQPKRYYLLVKTPSHSQHSGLG